jgi:glycosyltransferase involved in cell wall biosynthesis
MLARQISVIIPVFNRSTMVVEAIDSVVTQPGFTFQILVVDDGSSDDSAHAVEDLLAKGYSLTLLRHDQNRGASAARNTALAAAAMPLICFLDSDDLMCSGSFEAMWTLLDERPELDLAHGLRQDVATGPAAEAVHARAQTLPPDTLFLGGTLMRAELVQATGPFDEDLSSSEETEWFARIPHLFQRVGLHPGVTMIRRISGDNLTADTERLRRNRLAWVRKRLDDMH